MAITRRTANIAGLGLLAGCAGAYPAGAAEGPIADFVEGIEEFGVAIEAYTFGYPLVTMEMTRRVVTNVGGARRHPRPDGAVHPPARISGRHLPGRDRSERRHAVYDGLRGCGQRAVGFEHPGHEGALLPVPDARRLDQRVRRSPGKRTTGTGAQTYAITGPGWTGNCRPGSRSTSPRPAWSGYWGASTAPGRRRTMRPSMRFRTRASWCRSAPMARPIRRRLARSIPRST